MKRGNLFITLFTLCIYVFAILCTGHFSFPAFVFYEAEEKQYFEKEEHFFLEKLLKVTENSQ